MNNSAAYMFSVNLSLKEYPSYPQLLLESFEDFDGGHFDCVLQSNIDIFLTAFLLSFRKS